MPGTQVRGRRIGRGVLLEPIDQAFDVKAWFAAQDEYLDEPFMPDGRQQPTVPPARKVFNAQEAGYIRVAPRHSIASDAHVNGPQP